MRINELETLNCFSLGSPMPVLLFRVDDRLIHGQVTEGWGKSVKPDLIIIVSDDIAASEWESELCLAALPDTIKGEVVAVADAARVINRLESDARPSYVLFEFPRDAYAALQDGAHISTLNIGGMHSARGKREILDYLYVDEEDSNYIKSLSELGVQLDFRDLPHHENVDVLSKL